MKLDVRRAVEVFHLAFVGELAAKLDRGLYAVKGGCNLRFFFGSVRYSEDLDLDVQTVAVGTLRGKVDRLLASASFQRTLGVHGIEMVSSSRPEQTETTQRWKVAIRVGRVDAHTKVEFSRRGLDDGAEVGVVDPRLTSGYGLTQTLVSHYDRQAAFVQKLRALVGRSETQARDVFDLDLLLGDRSLLRPWQVDAQLWSEAQDRALAVDYDMFGGQVLAFLPAVAQSAHGSPQQWERLVLRVVDALAGAGKG